MNGPSYNICILLYINIFEKIKFGLFFCVLALIDECILLDYCLCRPLFCLFEQCPCCGG